MVDMEQHGINTILLMGRPGSGKGTQAKMLADRFGWTHFSTGDRFKVLRDEDSALGKNVREAYDAGKLLPDWFATYLFQDTAFTLEHAGGLVSEGYPRSVSQARIFDDILSWLARPYRVFDLAVPDEEVMRRMLARSEVEHRPDSATKEQIEARLSTYEEHTAPMLDFFKEKGLLVTIDGTQTPDEVEASILSALSA